MVWSSRQAKLGLRIFCGLCGLVVLCIALYQHEMEILYALIPIGMVTLITFSPSEEEVKAGITKETLIEEFGVKHIASEHGAICEKRIINDGMEFELIDEDGGYTWKTIRNIVARNAQKVAGKSIVIRMEQPDIMGRGTAYPNFGLYLETGRKVVAP